MKAWLRTRHAWRLLLLAAVTLVLAWLFIHFGSEVMEGELRALDVATRDWAMCHRNRALLYVFRGVTLLGAKEVLVPLALLIGWSLFPDRRRGFAILLFCGLASAEFVVVAKNSYGVQRPEGGLAVSRQFSFPSGHTAGAAAVWLFLAFVAARRRIHPVASAIAATAIVCLVGVSRVYLDMHWASDVLGGWIVGTTFAIGSAAMYLWLERRVPQAA